MNSARHQFMLLGFLCQGMAWGSYWHWLFSIAAWALLLGPWRNRFKGGPNLELAALVGGSALSLLAGKMLGQSSHFFLGDGVLCVQLARMLRPLSRREKLVSVLIAVFHVGVACTIAPDARFLVLALAALVLFPKALAELQSEEFGQVSGRLSWTALLALALVAVAVFVGVPRYAVGGPLQLGGGPPSGGGLLSSVLDPSSGGFANSAQVLMQVEGDDLQYFKCMALSQFDGLQWRVDERSGLRPFQRFLSEEELARLPSRRVRVKSVNFLGRVLPVDAPPVALRGRFFQKPLLNAQGVVETMSSWNTANNQYEYWIDPSDPPESLSAPLVRFYTRVPPPSERIARWAERIAAGSTNQLDLARRFEAHLRSSFTYRIGAPALNRLNSLEEFLFEKREGHCERFASALALLLRMQNIPARVAIGYVPGPPHRFSDWRPIRFKDAHAWTEAWFPDLGWVALDATPGGGGGPDDSFLGLTSMLEGLDLVWYSHVISFDGSSQRRIVTGVMGAVGALSRLPSRFPAMVALLIVAGLLPLLLRRARARSKRSSPPTPSAQSAGHFYGELLRLLARRGIHRSPHQTPLEFLRDLEARNVGALAEIAEVTRVFCRSRYGELDIAPAEMEALRRLNLEIDQALGDWNGKEAGV